MLHQKFSIWLEANFCPQVECQEMLRLFQVPLWDRVGYCTLLWECTAGLPISVSPSGCSLMLRFSFLLYCTLYCTVAFWVSVGFCANLRSACLDLCEVPILIQLNMPSAYPSRSRTHSHSERSELIRHPMPQVLKQYSSTSHSPSSNKLNQPDHHPSPTHEPSKPPIMDSANTHHINAFHLAGLGWWSVFGYATAYIRSNRSTHWHLNHSTPITVNDKGGEYEKYRKSPEELKSLVCYSLSLYSSYLFLIIILFLIDNSQAKFESFTNVRMKLWITFKRSILF